MGPHIRYFYEYGFDSAIKQQSDPSFTGVYDKEGPLANLPPPLDFHGDSTRLIEEAWWLPVFKQTISSLLKLELTLAALNPMKDPLYPAIIDHPTSQEKACMARALDVEVTEDPPSSSPV